MKVLVQPVGLLKNYFETGIMELEEDSGIQEVIKLRQIPSGLKVVAMLDGRRLTDGHILKDGDCIKLVCLALGG